MLSTWRRQSSSTCRQSWLFAKPNDSSDYSATVFHIVAFFSLAQEVANDDNAPVFRLILLSFFMQATTAVTSPYAQVIFRNKGYSNTLVGIVLAVGQAASVIMPILLCMLSDNTRKTRRIAFILIAASTALFYPAAKSGSLLVTCLAFFLSFGMFWTMNPMMDGYESRLLEGDPAKYGMARSAGTLGYLICLILFALTGFPDETSNDSILLCMVIVNSLFAASLLIAPKDLPRKEGESKSRMFSISWFSRKYYLMMLVIAIGRMGETVINRMLSGYMTEVLNLGSRFTLMIALGAFSEMIMMFFGGRLMAKGRLTAFNAIMLGSIAMAARLLIYYLFPNVVAFTFAQLLHSMTFGLLHVGATRFIAQNVKEEHYSVAMSLYWAMATNFPQMIGALIGGVIVDHIGYSGLFLIFAVFPIVSVALGYGFKGVLSDNESKD